MSANFLTGDFAVTIKDLSGGNGAEAVETIRGFTTLAHANAFARRYVRDSVERCRSRGMSADEVLAAWFAFGEDAEVTGAEGAGWTSGAEIKAFAAASPTDPEDRAWRAIDPRRIAQEDDDDADDAPDGDGDGDGDGEA
ncbi:hypothetical protein C8P66_12176 [Humitalea rosea]|uniref:Uncharacterized protein n=1 Tax=Humitalea rosea TaxID=990373 RepID=A0A2W7I553_9PROT|nr:hypothetical protein [Humitalea rosea]PZW41368.1 hypothetical protein C8P66_12176 [Humitalea rosea]